MQILLTVVVGACFVYLLCVFVAFLFMLVGSALEHAFLVRDAGNDDCDRLLRSRFTIPVSVIAPAFNEETLIEPAVRSMLALDYPEFEVIVVNDGSRDRTLEILTRAFDLVPRAVFYRRQFATADIRGVYRSRLDPRLTVVDKENGGKADALNAGVNLARYRYICTVDSDTIYFPHALIHSMRVVMRDPGRIVGVTASLVLSSHPEARGPARQRIDDRPLLNWQLLDYFRAFMNNRLGWTRGNFMLCSVGAFAIWRHDIVVELGGFSGLFTCEDIEFTFRVHERMRREKRPYRVVALAESVCRTEGPDTVRSLVRQRSRWHRVITETVWHYRRMLFNPRYGSVGIVGVPYYVLVEVLAPIFEVLALVALPVAWWIGALDLGWFLIFVLAIALWNGILTNVAILLYDRATPVYPSADLQRLMALGVADLFGYRLILIAAQVIGLVDFLRGKKTWDKFERNRRTALAA